MPPHKPPGGRAQGVPEVDPLCEVCGDFICSHAGDRLNLNCIEKALKEFLPKLKRAIGNEDDGDDGNDALDGILG